MNFAPIRIYVPLLVSGMISLSATAPASEAYLVAEVGEGLVLATKNESQPRQVASLTKIAAALVALEWCDETGNDPEQWKFSVPVSAIRGGANPLGLKEGDELTLATGLRAAMMASDNTSTYAFADAIGREMGGEGDGVARFVGHMNALATRLGMRDTRFVNPHGLDEGEEKGVSTAGDLARLSLAAIDRPGFLSYGGEREREVAFLREGREVKVTLANTNELVASRGIDGMKTGTTRLSGPCLIATATRELSLGGRPVTKRLVVVVLAAEDRFREAVLLLDQGWSVLGGAGGSETKERLRKETD